MARTEPWRVSDEFWEKVQPLIPPTPSHAKGGRTRMDDRQAFAAMIYVLRTGIQWNALPRQMGASSTVHDRYQEWERLGFFEQLWQAGAGGGPNRHDSRLLVATLDGLVVARPAREGEKDSPEQHLCLDAAYDSDEVRQELEARSYEPHISPADERKRSERKRARQHPGGRARRWVVERTHSWLNRSRRLLVRWEKKTENYLAFIHLACAQLIFSKILVSG